MNTRKPLALTPVASTSLLLLLLTALPASAEDAACEETYRTCQQRLAQHARCAEQYPEDLVGDAAAIFELEHRLETSTETAAFGADPSTRGHLEGILDGLLSTSDASLSRPGQVENVLIGDLHFRHAERLARLLEAPHSCDESALAKLERSCRAGIGEARALTQGDWPAHVATCISSRPSAPAVAP